MSVTLTYDGTLSRVRVSATALGSALTALFEKSTDQITWTTVRGGAAVTVTAGAAALDDYEFTAGVVNYYRVTSIADIAFVSVGTVTHAVNAAVTPGMPAGAVAGDLLLLWTAIRITTGNPNPPAGYTLIRDLGNSRLFGKIHTGSESAPNVTFSGGAASEDTTAQMAAFRNVSLDDTVNAFNHLQGPAQNIAYPALTVPTIHSLILYIGWKQDDWTSVATLAGDGGTGVEIDEPDTTTGNDQGLVWDYCIQNTTSPTNVAAGSFTVTGGGSAISSSSVISLPAVDLVQSNSTTPTLDTVWLKSIARPFLNMPVVPRKPYPPVNTAARSGVFPIIGRSDPIAVTDVRSGLGYTLVLDAPDPEDMDKIDLLLAGGDILFVHVPPGIPRPSMYAAAGDAVRDDDDDSYQIGLARVAAPGPDVVGSTSTWQTVISTYATWSDVIAAHATWADLLELVGDPSEVVVP